MNENKIGKLYSFHDSFILLIGDNRKYFHLPCIDEPRDHKSPRKHSSRSSDKLFVDCRKRGLNKSVEITSNRLDYNDNHSIIIAIDSTGIKVTNRGQWMQQENGRLKRRKAKYSHCYCKYKDQRNSCKVTGEKECMIE